MENSQSETPRPDIIADDRERGSQVLEMLRADFHMNVQEKRLALGDYEIAGSLIIERKTIDDFAQSLVDGRLFGQIARMKAQTDNALLVLEGDLSQPLGIGTK